MLNEIQDNESGSICTLRDELECKGLLDAAHAIWSRLEDLRNEVALGGKELLISLIFLKMGESEQNSAVIADKMSGLMGCNVYNLIYDLIGEFEGTDHANNLWVKVEMGGYCPLY